MIFDIYKSKDRTLAPLEKAWEYTAISATDEASALEEFLTGLLANDMFAGNPTWLADEFTLDNILATAKWNEYICLFQARTHDSGKAMGFSIADENA